MGKTRQWAFFIGKDRGALRLTTKPEPYTYERTFNWLRHQVAPTLESGRHNRSIKRNNHLSET